MKKKLTDHLDVFAKKAIDAVKKGYYNVKNAVSHESYSLKKAILECALVPVIAEIKPASPSIGVIRRYVEASSMAMEMVRGGAVGLSVITMATGFGGSLSNLAAARSAVKAPVLMKDFIVSQVQLEAAHRLGADAVLLIQGLFDRGYSELAVKDMVTTAHALNLEVLLEAHDEREFKAALATDADMVGINNRDLATLRVDLNVTRRILARHRCLGRPVISESGISTVADLRYVIESGADAALVGSSIMNAENVYAKVQELANMRGGVIL